MVTSGGWSTCDTDNNWILYNARKVSVKYLGCTIQNIVLHKIYITSKTNNYFVTSFFSYDKLYVYQGNSTDSGIEATFSGALTNLPMVFGPYDTQMLLGFSSDASSNYPGFNVTYMTGKSQLTEILLTWCNLYISIL